MSGNQYIYQRVWEIHETLHPKPDDLVSTARFFVREGELQIWDAKKKKKKKRYFFLFNDIILLCRKENQKRYWLRIHITLRSPHVTVEEIESSSFNNEFRLHCRSRSFMLYAPTPDIRKEWVEDLRRSIQGTHAEEKKDKDKPEEKEEKRKSVKKIAQPIKKDAAKKVRDEDDSDDSDDDEESPESEEEQKTKRTAAKDDTKTPRSASTKTKRKNPPPQQQQHPQQEQHPQQSFDPFAFSNPYGGGLPAGAGGVAVGGGYTGAPGASAGFGSNPYGGMNPGLGVNTPNNNLQRIQTNTAPFTPSAQPNPFFPSNNQSIISAPPSNPFATPSPFNNPGLNYNPITPSPQGAFNAGVGGGLSAQGGFNAGVGGGIAAQGGFNAGVGVGISAQGGGYNVAAGMPGGIPGLGQNQFGTNPQMGNPFANPGTQPVNPFAPSATPVNPFLNGGSGNFTSNPF